MKISNPPPAAFNIKPARAIECWTTRKDDGRCDIYVEGHVDNVETGEPITVKSHTTAVYPPTPEDFRSLLVTWFDHEVREQLGMDPHGPVDVVAVHAGQARIDAEERADKAEAEVERLASAKADEATAHARTCVKLHAAQAELATARRLLRLVRTHGIPSGTLSELRDKIDAFIVNPDETAIPSSDGKAE